MDEVPPLLTQAYWEDVFEEEDPWSYATSDYERWKFDETLALLPAAPIRRALEIGCAEGHLTARLAPRVGGLVAMDISGRALLRARERCASAGNVEFVLGNLAFDPLPERQDLILCSEVLFYLPMDVLRTAAGKIASSLEMGGHLLLAHGNLISDDPDTTGFDWGHPFGARTIGEVFGSLDGLALVSEARSPLFTIQLFRRVEARAGRPAAPSLVELPLPFDLELTPELEKTILWDGAVMTRDEALARETTARVPILMYHSIADEGPAELAPYRVTPAAFAEQLRFLRRHGFHSLGLAEWLAAITDGRPLPGRPVILTFDDGYKDFITTAWPALDRNGFSATVFVVTERVGKTADWDSPGPKPLKLMSWADLKTLAAAGVEIGSHTASHKDLETASFEQCVAEGEQSRSRLREKLGLDVEILAFPWGRHDDASREALADCGYRACVTTWGPLSSLEDDPMQLPRIEIMGDDELAVFAEKVMPPPLPADFSGAGQAGFLDDETVGFDAPAPIAFAEPAQTAPRGPNMPGSSAEPRSIADLDPDPAVGFDLGLSPAASPPPYQARGVEPSIHPEYAHDLSARSDGSGGEFISLQTQLINSVGATPTLQKKLTSIFSQPLTGAVERSLGDVTPIGLGIELRCEDGAEVRLTMEPKTDHALSPETYLNVMRLDLVGPTVVSLVVPLAWSDLQLGERFQLNFCAQPTQPLSCCAELTLPDRTGGLRPVTLSNFHLFPEQRNAMVNGDLRLPDFIELDTSRSAELIIYLNAESDLTIILHYLNVYFA
jgi:peptidoglycan/xylan/chitin deacetylase (PgdA/CDA1 family)/SAM-dependent methyltransferase